MLVGPSDIMFATSMIALHEATSVFANTKSNQALPDDQALHSVGSAVRAALSSVHSQDARSDIIDTQHRQARDIGRWSEMLCMVLI